MNDEVKIVVVLPKDRRQAGQMSVYKGDQQVLALMMCKGKADNKRAAENGNPSRDQTKPWGDTPTGIFKGKVVLFGDESERFGIGWLPMKGDPANNDNAGKAVANGRTGLAIHGGRGNERLVPTYGCVRLTDLDFAHLAHVCGDQEVTIAVVDEGF